VVDESLGGVVVVVLLVGPVVVEVGCSDPLSGAVGVVVDVVGPDGC
jgi:hypothetical protein